MIEFPVILTGHGVGRDGVIPVLNQIMLLQFRLKRINERSLCATTIHTLQKPYRDRNQNGLSLEDAVQHGLTQKPVSMLFETTVSFVTARTHLVMLGRHSEFLFLPDSETHAKVMRSMLF